MKALISTHSRVLSQTEEHLQLHSTRYAPMKTEIDATLRSTFLLPSRPAMPAMTARPVMIAMPAMSLY